MTTEPAEISEALRAGADLPEAAITIFNGAKQKVTKGNLGGERQQFLVTQRVWYCPSGEYVCLYTAVLFPHAKKSLSFVLETLLHRLKY